MGFVNVTGKTRGQALAQTLEITVEGWSLDMQKCRGLSFDGASNMSGHINGAAAAIQRKYPLATYIHCSSHWYVCMQLCCVSSNVNEIQFFLCRSIS